LWCSSSTNSFPSYSNRKCKKIAVFTYHSPHFCFPWRRPCDYHAMCCMDGKTILCLPNPSQHVPIYLEYFPSYTMLKSMRKSKNRYFYIVIYIVNFIVGSQYTSSNSIRCMKLQSVSPGDAPGAITLNVACMEREFDAYKLSRCMCSPNYNRFSDRARYWSKIVIFSYPLAFDAPIGGLPLEYRHYVSYGKTRMA